MLTLYISLHVKYTVLSDFNGTSILQADILYGLGDSFTYILELTPANLWNSQVRIRVQRGATVRSLPALLSQLPGVNNNALDAGGSAV